MRAYLWRMFAGSLGLTVAAGVPVKGQEEFGTDEKKAVYASDIVYTTHSALGFDYLMNNLLTVLVNLLTNPPAVLVCWLGRLWMPPGLQLYLQLAVEALVVAVEGGVYGSFGRKPGWKIKRPMLFALAANGTSWLLGLWLS